MIDGVVSCAQNHLHPPQAEGSWPALSCHSIPAGAPPLYLRSLQGQGGVFDFPKSERRAEWEI
jgi:hypothetical protein